MRNPKSEIRRPKEARNPKLELGSAGTPAGVSSATNASQLAGRGAGAPGHTASRLRAFGIRASDFFGILDFGFRISTQEDLNG